MKKPSAHFAAALGGFLVCFSFRSPCSEGGPSGLESKVRAALERAGGNAGEIGAFLSGLTGEKLQAGRFLVAYMPAADLASLDASSLKENLDLAFRAREVFPWGKRVPFPLFLHYVLPHRFAQEAFQRWRPFFFREMKKLLEGCVGMRDAVRAANRWCARRVKFIQTEWRDQTPLDTLKSGYGRCEEMMEVTLAALRAAGIPARPCSAPWWVVYDNNHAWVEVWVDGAWHYIGGCEDTPLDRTWFRGPARRAGLVVSVMYGSPEEFDPGDRVYKILPDAALINSTPVYTATGILEVRVLDGRGRPVPGCPFAVSVFNFGGLRALTSRRTGPDGKARVILGLGDFFLSAGKGGERAYRVAAMKPGKTTLAELRLREGAVPPSAFWLRYPTPAEAERYARNLPTRGAPGRPRFDPHQAPPPPLDLYEKGKDPALERLLEGFSGAKELRGILADARANWREVAAGLKALGRDLLPLGLEFLKRTAHLDRVEMTPAVLLDQVRWAAGTRREEIPEKVFYSWVLNGRIDLENLGPWRGLLGKEFSSLLGGKPAVVVKSLLEWTGKNLKGYARGRFGPYMNPGQVLVSRRALSREKAIFLVGALRSLGIPARKRPNLDRVEFWDRGEWKEAVPGAPAAALGAQAPPARVSLFLTRKGKPFFSARGLAFSRFVGGKWNPLRRLPFQRKGMSLRVNLGGGEYLFTAGTRNPNGDPWIQAVPLRLPPGGRASLGLCLDLPSGSGIFRFPVARKLSSLPVLKTSGPSLDLREVTRKGPLLLFLFLPAHEPSTRALPMAARAFPALEKVGVKGVGLLLPGSGKPLSGKLPFPVYRAGWDAARALGIPAPPAAGDHLPSVLLLQKGGKPLLWVEGYETKLEALLEAAARQVRN